MNDRTYLNPPRSANWLSATTLLIIVELLIAGVVYLARHHGGAR